MNSYEIEKMLKKEIIQQKRIGRGAFNRKASGMKGSKVGKLNTPTAFLTEAQIRKKYNSKVKVFNMNDFLSREDFLKQEISMQKLLMENWRSKFSIREIAKGLGCGSSSVYAIIDNLGIKKNPIESHNYKDRIELLKNELLDILNKGNYDYEKFLKLKKEQQGYLYLKSVEKNGIMNSLDFLVNKRDNANSYVRTNVVSRLKAKYGIGWEEKILNAINNDVTVKEIESTHRISKYSRNNKDKAIVELEGMDKKELESTDNKIDDIAITALNEANEIDNENRSVVETVENIELAIDREIEIPEDCEVEVEDNTDLDITNEDDESISLLDINGIFTKDVLLMLLNRLKDEKKYRLKMYIEQY